MELEFKRRQVDDLLALHIGGGFDGLNEPKRNYKFIGITLIWFYIELKYGFVKCK